MAHVAFLFDLDGTLIDSVYQHVLAWREALEQVGMALPAWIIHRRVGMSGGLIASALQRETGRPVSTALGDRIDGFKALTPFYLQKMKNAKPEEDDDLPNFSNFANQINATENQDGEREPGVRDRRRNGSAAPA